MSAPAIEIRGLQKTFGEKKVFVGLDLDIHSGETLTVLGPSGTGKSVLLKLLMGLEKPDAGSIAVDGKNIVPLSERELRPFRRRIAMLFQGAALFDAMSVGENIEYGLKEYEAMKPAEMGARVAECLAAVGLPGIEAMRPSELSGGMQKRVGLARALALKPEMILYDEPTTGLDPSNTVRINKMIIELNKKFGITSLVITHDIASALEVSDRIALVADGKLQLMTDAEEARRSPPAKLEAFMRGEEKL